ncbi:ATP-binding protein [Nonomuraea aridisoli]|nr:hypothetical protein [Nonomuraea aridisoli]
MSRQWHAGNLPSEPTSLVGRRAELDEVRRACRRSRLVTLTGVGGVGKSRLALRAADTVPGFEPADDREAVVRLCRRLEGIPLAIELAAARLRELPVRHLVDRLDDRFAALGDDDAGAPHEAEPPWHRALRTTVGWSHELCEPAERLLWARLSVFCGDFDVEAARAVCADERLPEAGIGLLLDALAEESILTWLPAGAGERYRMLDTLREYGAGWLRDLGEQELVRRRHRDHFLALARRGADGWLGPGQIAWYDRMIGEHDNLRAALENALAAQDAVPALELAGTLAFFWYGCGYVKEGRHYLGQALALDATPGPALVQALWADGLLAATQGDADGAETRAAQCEAAAGSGDAYARTCVAALRALAGAVRGDLAQVMAASEAVCQARGDGDPTIAELVTSLCRAHALTVGGRVGEAIAVLEELRMLCDARGEQSMRSHGDLMRGQAELCSGRPDAATAHGQAALRTKWRLHDSFGVCLAVDLLALAAGAAGRALRAARLLGLAQRLWSAHGEAQAGVPAWVAARRACERQARDALGDDAYRVAYRTGFDGDVDAGIAYALRPEGEGLLPDGGPLV